MTLGMGSPRDMIKPFHQLSNGLQHMAHVARALQDGATFDEFCTSVENSSARCRCIATGLAVLVREENIRNVVVATNRPMEVYPWLRPKWMYHCGERKYLCRQGPSRLSEACVYTDCQAQILDFPAVKPHIVRFVSEPAEDGRSEYVPADLNIHCGRDLGMLEGLIIEMRSCSRKVWDKFRFAHYKAGDVSTASRCYVATLPNFGGIEVGFVAVIPQPGRYNSRAVRSHRGHWREHRVCVAEEWQGIGIGTAITGNFACT
mmetsp:Transcript_6758/g.21133  ORF Transcript_6758/g.21133 Transcript_6758/m.21133 type:complete len:260 (-) Transcript_6758:1128-1907(-)